MNTMIVGKYSSVGLSLVQSGLFENVHAIDRRQMKDLMSSKETFRKYVEKNNIENIIYLMVDRTMSDSNSEQISIINYLYPIQMWEVVSELSHVTFVWVSSIFANDTSMVIKNLYLRTQNLAHGKIMENNAELYRYSRLYLSQLYGTSDFVNHQPFLYKLNDTIKAGQDIELLNGHNSYRNFLNIRDVCRVLADSKSWISNPNVSFLSRASLTWLEIAQVFKSFYESKSSIKNVVDPTVFNSRTYLCDNLTSLTELYKPQNLNTVIMNGEFK